MARMADPTDPISPPSMMQLLLEGRAIGEMGAFFAAAPWLRLAPRGDGHHVLVLPGLATGDASTLALRNFLADRGYGVHGWGLGQNRGPRSDLYDRMAQRLRSLHRQTGRKVSLVGWSLGGIYARELARQAPHEVRLVITLGSPFTGHPKATNAWRLYEMVSGRKSADRPVRAARRPAPPVPTTSIYSRSDGVVAWQCSVEQPGPTTENIEVEASHMGMGHHPAVLYAIADRLAQPEGAWRPFDRSGLKQLMYPDPSR